MGLKYPALSTAWDLALCYLSKSDIELELLLINSDWPLFILAYRAVNAHVQRRWVTTNHQEINMIGGKFLMDKQGYKLRDSSVC